MNAASTAILGLLALVLPGCDAEKIEEQARETAADSPTDTGPWDEDEDGWTLANDCDDGDEDISPEAVERCDGLDNDCDGLVDDDDDSLDSTGLATFYLDADGDGFGTDAGSTQACAPPEGYADNTLDCDDSSPRVYPGADEVCDGLDNDCDDEADDEPLDGDWYYPDEDQDGLGAQGELALACKGATSPLDCDDTDPTEPQVVDDDSDELMLGTLAFPWPTIQAGIDAADACVLVFAGTYTEAIDFVGKNLQVLGAEGAEVTTIDATGLSASTVTFASGEGEGARLEGFTITGGTGTEESTSSSYACGSRETCTEYTTTWCGGGIYVEGASPALVDLVITGNSLPEASTTTSGNDTWYVNSFGGGLCLIDASVTLSGVHVESNFADVGGGAWLDETSYAEHSASALTGNLATEGGGWALDGGSLLLTNVLSAWNTAVTMGGGVYLESGELDASQVTWGGDDAPSGGALASTGTGTLTVWNSILYGAATGAGAYRDGTGPATFGYSAFYGNAGGPVSGLLDPTDSNGNITEDPLFVAVSDDGDPSNDDWHLAAGSPCLDAGDPSTAPEADGSAADMGAYGGPGGSWP